MTDEPLTVKEAVQDALGSLQNAISTRESEGDWDDALEEFKTVKQRMEDIVETLEGDSE